MITNHVSLINSTHISSLKISYSGDFPWFHLLLNQSISQCDTLFRSWNSWRGTKAAVVAVVRGPKFAPWWSVVGNRARDRGSVLIYQLEPPKAVAEVLKIGNLHERLAVVMHGWQSKATDGSKGGWSVGLFICLSICLSNSLTHYLTNYLATSLTIWQINQLSD